MAYGRNSKGSRKAPRKNVKVAARRRTFGRAKRQFGRKRRRTRRSMFSGVHGRAGSTWSSYRYGHRTKNRWLKGQMKNACSNFWTTNASFRISAGIGTQNADTISTYKPTDVAIINNLVSANATTKVAHKTGATEIMLTNQSTGTVRVYLYDIICRRDNNTVTAANPYIAWQNSYLAEGSANVDYSIVGTTPFSATMFTQFYVVKKITHITMQQGESHIHRTKVIAERLLQDQYVLQAGSGFGKLTHYTMIVVHGMPYNDTVTKTSVSTGLANIDVVYRQQYNYDWFQDNDTNFTRVNNLITVFATTESVQNVGTGTVTLETPA